MTETPERPRLRPGPKTRGSRFIGAEVMIGPQELAEVDRLALALRRSRSDLVRESIRARIPIWKREAAREEQP